MYQFESFAQNSYQIFFHYQLKFFKNKALYMCLNGARDFVKAEKISNMIIFVVSLLTETILQLFLKDVLDVLGYPQGSVVGSPYGIMTKVLDYGLKVSEFKLQLHYYVHFWTNTFLKGMKPLFSPAMH